MAPKLRTRGAIKIRLASAVLGPVFLLAAVAAIVGGTIHVAWSLSAGDPELAGGLIAMIAGLPIAFLSWRAVTGAPHLLVDVPAGMIHHLVNRHPTSCALAGLGPLAVETYKRATGRYMLDWYRLRAPGLGGLLLVDGPYEKPARALADTLATLVAASALRAVLATATTGGGAFRQAPDLILRLRDEVPDREMRARGLGLLIRDPDPAVRSRASELAAVDRAAT